MNKPNPAKAAAGSIAGAFKSFTNAIDDVVNEVKADLKAMTPPDQADAKKAAEQAARASQLQGIIGQSAAGVQEVVAAGEEVPAMPPENETAAARPATGLPTGNLWEALANPAVTRRLRTDACYHALTVADIQNYRKAVGAEKEAPFTMGIAAIILQAPLEEEIDDAGNVTGDDFLLTALLKALEETRLYGAVGAGPRQLWPNLDALDDALTALLNNNPKLIALGPLGIDEPFAPYQVEAQQAQLAVQLDIAADFNLPVILTHRQSLPHLAAVLRNAQQLPPLVWMDVLNTPEELALTKEFGMYVILRPEITAPDFPAAHLYRDVPPAKRLLASGSALVAPHGFQGHFNQPRFLQNTLQAAARVLFMPEGDVTTLTNTNLASLFKK